MPKQYMSVKEFREAGYLQELNRQFLHPLGLALVTRIEDYDGGLTIEKLDGITDFRDDPEGLIFAEGVMTAEKAANIKAQQEQRFPARQQALGFIIQPPPEDDHE